jgi:nicotinate-nucleotide pyrophosphorylase
VDTITIEVEIEVDVVEDAVEDVAVAVDIIITNKTSQRRNPFWT